MELEWKLFADLAERAGGRRVTVEVDPDATVGDALEAVLEGRPELRERVLADGSLRSEINVLRNGSDVETDGGLDAPVEDDDELALFPPVSGG